MLKCEMVPGAGIQRLHTNLKFKLAGTTKWVDTTKKRKKLLEYLLKSYP